MEIKLPINNEQKAVCLLIKFSDKKKIKKIDIELLNNLFSSFNEKYITIKSNFFNAEVTITPEGEKFYKTRQEMTTKCCDEICKRREFTQGDQAIYCASLLEQMPIILQKYSFSNHVELFVYETIFGKVLNKYSVNKIINTECFLYEMPEIKTEQDKTSFEREVGLRK